MQPPLGLKPLHAPSSPFSLSHPPTVGPRVLDNAMRTKDAAPHSLRKGSHIRDDYPVRQHNIEAKVNPNHREWPALPARDNREDRHLMVI